MRLGRLCDMTDRPDEAAACLERAIRHGADWPDVHCLAGEALARTASPLRAKEHFERALALKSDYTPAHKALAALAA